MVNVEQDIAPLLPASRTLKRAFWLAVLLSLGFLGLTAFQSASTLYSRVATTDVMDAAMDGALSGRVGLEVAWFMASLILLHLAMGVLAWALACASAVLWQRIREKFKRHVVGWFALFACASVAYSALWHPRTLLGAYYHDLLSHSLGGIPAGRVFYVSVLVFAAAVLAMASWRVARTATLALRWRVAAVAVPASLVALAMLSAYTGRDAVASARETAQPNVIIIGIDSLRLDRVRRYGGQGLTPNLDAFLSEADLFPDTTTPLARTFPSWISILTGRSPATTGSRFNLANRQRVKSMPTVADVLRSAGYRTVFSMDEARFANIDESYGFDQIVSPRMGAPDFILGTYNELPLSSLVINTRLGKWMFPYSHANRGAATMYEPDTYVGRLEREVSFDQPTLLITHLTGAHWPYYTAGTQYGIKMKGEAAADRPLYDDALRTVDRMFGDIVQMLQRKGALGNAIVVVLSDHGEALGLPNDTFFADGAVIEGLRAPIKMLDVGHGQSVLSQSQYQVMLGFRSFGNSPPFKATGRDLDAPASVEDLSPTLLELLGMEPDKLTPSGTSLASLLRNEAAADSANVADERIRFTETDLRVLPAQNGFDEEETAKENSKYFEIDSITGRLHIREYMAPLAIGFKERAAFTKTKLLAAIPAGPETAQYLYFDRHSGYGRLLMENPGAADPEAARLWDALVEHFGSEIKPPVVVTMQDWPALDVEWANFLSSLRASKKSGTVPAGGNMSDGRSAATP